MYPIPAIFAECLLTLGAEKTTVCLSTFLTNLGSFVLVGILIYQ